MLQDRKRRDRKGHFADDEQRLAAGGNNSRTGQTCAACVGVLTPPPHNGGGADHAIAAHPARPFECGGAREIGEIPAVERVGQRRPYHARLSAF
jgi:hypothetical protein